MLLKGAAGSRGMWARISLRGSTLLWEEVSSHNKRLRKGGEGGMSKEGGPSRDEGSGDGLAQGVWALAGSGFGEVADGSSLQRPPASTPKTTKRQRPGWTSSRHVRSLDPGPSRIPLCLTGEGGSNGGVNSQLVSSPRR